MASTTDNGQVGIKQAALVSTIHHEPYPAILETKEFTKGKTVFISGGASGIGFVIARHFAIAGAATVVIAARRRDSLEAAQNKLAIAFPDTQFLAFPLDITDDAAVISTFSEARKQARIGDIDILVTCAAYFQSAKTILDSHPETDIRASFETNVLGNLNLVRAFLSETITFKGKVIVDVSTMSIHVELPNMAMYSSSKAAFTSALRHLHLENPDLAIRSFHPGSIWTSSVEAFGFKKEDFPWDDENLAGAFAVWLASDDAAFLNGKFVWSAWDVDEMKARAPELVGSQRLSTLALSL